MYVNEPEVINTTKVEMRGVATPLTIKLGGLAEWFIATVLKTVLL